MLWKTRYWHCIIWILYVGCETSWHFAQKYYADKEFSLLSSEKSFDFRRWCTCFIHQTDVRLYQITTICIAGCKNGANSLPNGLSNGSSVDKPRNFTTEVYVDNNYAFEGKEYIVPGIIFRWNVPLSGKWFHRAKNVITVEGKQYQGNRQLCGWSVWICTHVSTEYFRQLTKLLNVMTTIGGWGRKGF